MIIKSKNVRDLTKCFSQMRLIEMAGIVVEIGVANVFFVFCSPRRILASLLSTHGCPLLQERQLLPKSISVDLTTKTKLHVEPSTFGVLLENVLPHQAYAT